MYKTTNMIIKNPIYLLSKNNATAVIPNNYLCCENFNHKKYLLGHSLAELVCNFVPDKKNEVLCIYDHYT